MIYCIVGPTASGKSQLALALAQRKNGVIINADSRQLYQEMDIGTAKPTPQEQSLVSHRLFDVTTLSSVWNVALYVKEAIKVIEAVLDAGQTPVIVGGTGLYIQSLFYGMDTVPAVPVDISNALQKRLESEGLAILYAELRRFDIKAGERLNPNDSQRILRALGVYHTTGKPLSEFWTDEKTTCRWPDVKFIGLNPARDELYDRINARVDTMVTRGLKAECLALAKKYGSDNEILQKTIGYSEWLSDIPQSDDRITDAIKQNSRRYAKRQLTWFRNKSQLEWFDHPEKAFKAFCS